MLFSCAIYYIFARYCFHIILYCHIVTLWLKMKISTYISFYISNQLYIWKYSIYFPFTNDGKNLYINSHFTKVLHAH